MPRASARTTADHGTTSRRRFRPRDSGAPIPRRSKNPSFPTTSPVIATERGRRSARTARTQPRGRPDSVVTSVPRSSDSPLHGAGDPLDPRTKAVVSPAEPVLGRRLAQMYRRVDLLDLRPGHAHRRRTRQRREQPPSRPRPRQYRRPDEDRLDPRLAGHPSIARSSTLPQRRPSLVDELVVEQPTRCRSRSFLSHVREDHQRDRGTARRPITRGRPTRAVREAAVYVRAHVRPVVRDEQDRQVGERQRDDREDHRVLGEQRPGRPGHHDPEGEQEQHDPGQREPGRAARLPVAAPLPAAELREVVRAREDGVDRGAADGEQDPDKREEQPDLAERLVRAERDRPEVLRLRCPAAGRARRRRSSARTRGCRRAP